MDPLAALLNEHPPPQLSASELRSRIALHEAAVRAYRAELEGRTTLDALPEEIQQVIFGQLCNALDPRDAVAYCSASKGLREPVQRIGEGASKSPLQQLKEDHAAAAALGLKMGVWNEKKVGVLNEKNAPAAALCPKLKARSCKALREATRIWWSDRRLSAAHLKRLGKLIPVLPALESLSLGERSDSVGVGPVGVQRLAEGLVAGSLPAVTCLSISCMHVGDAGASALAAALDRGALPRLKRFALWYTAIGDAGLVALAPALRRRPALETLQINGNPFGDEGLAALVAPPPADAPPPRAEPLPMLKELELMECRITDAGCAHLGSRLRSGALPALFGLYLAYIPASDAAIDAIVDDDGSVRGRFSDDEEDEEDEEGA